jgi:hypothetical protein
MGELVRKFVKSISQSGSAAELADSLGEVALDQTLTDGVLREIPIIGTAISLARAGNDIAGYFYAKKILRFLQQVEVIPEMERRAFLEKEAADVEDERNLGEVTLMVLDKLDAPLLAAMLGRAFAKYVQGGHRATFEIQAHIIRALNPYLIRQLTQAYESEGVQVFDAPAALLLANYGLFDADAQPTFFDPTKHRTRQIMHPNEFGKAFYKEIVAPCLDSKS